MSKRLIMYSRSYGCPYITVARRVLADYAVDYLELYIDQDDEARERVRAWTGFLSVPTLVVAEGDSLLPTQPPTPLPSGASPRGIDRGDMITEANTEELAHWLLRHGLIAEIVES